MGHFTLIEGRLLKLGALQLQVLQLALGKQGFMQIGILQISAA